ncbi:MAG: hypothetical protein ACI89J_004314 [Hyphomicrobiaceae bacterium]|jgi:hypothetical protein
MAGELLPAVESAGVVFSLTALFALLKKQGCASAGAGLGPGSLEQLARGAPPPSP